MADVDFKPDSAGIQEICKSAGMQAALLSCAEDLAAQANLRADPKNARVSAFEVPPYAAHVDVLDRTAVGAAHTNGKIGQLNESLNFDLAKQCH